MRSRIRESARAAFVAVTLALSIGVVVAQPATRQVARSGEAARIDRLAGLAKAWGAIKYFHPAIAQRHIDWDAALIATIPKVNAASTRADYIAALNSALAALEDPGTVARPRTASAAEPSAMTPGVAGVQIRDGVLWIDPLVASMQAPAEDADTQPIAVAVRLAATATAIVFDLRSCLPPSDEQAYQRDGFLRGVLPELLDREVSLGAMRFRAHSGHPPQDGGTSGGYYSTLATTAPEWVVGRNKTKPPQFVFVVDQHTTALEYVAGLQDHGYAYVVQAGASPGFRATLPLTADVELRLTTSELVTSDGGIGFAADLVTTESGATEAIQAVLNSRNFKSTRITPTGAVSAPVDAHDASYPEMAFPTNEYRMLALFRYWNAIDRFYPNKDLIERDWDGALTEYIARFEANRSIIDYQTTVLRLAAETQDSHSFTSGADAVATRIGTHVVPLQLREIEGRTVVAQVLEPTSPVQRGDELLSVDAVPVAKRIAELAPIIAAATPQALSVGVHNSLLRGAKDSVATLRLRNPAGAIRTIALKRAMARTDVHAAAQRRGPTFRRLDAGIGYVDLARLQLHEIEPMFAAIALTDATIFDMRGYPNGTAWAIAPRLGTRKSPVNALFSRPYLEGYALGDNEIGATTYGFVQRLPAADGKPYLGKVVMLIDAEAISQAEHTCLMFEVATDVTFIGTPTMGANGDVTNVTLPGGIVAHFGGHNVRHADGRPLQRVGIQPTIRVEPTIAGVAAGKDEILDAAIAFLDVRRKDGSR